jgi:hypothetical protein
MVHTFCTLTQAAAMLETTEPELRAMLEEGTLREFRDGPHRFLKMADLKALMVAHGVAGDRKPSPGIRRERKPSQPADSIPAAAPYRHDIKLPATAAVISRTGHSRMRPSGNTLRAAPSAASRPSTSPPPHRQVPGANHPQSLRPAAAAPTFNARRAKPQMHEVSFREWVWAGLIDDRPHTIVVLSLIVVAGVCGLAGAVYLLSRIFVTV